MPDTPRSEVGINPTSDRATSPNGWVSHGWNVNPLDDILIQWWSLILHVMTSGDVSTARIYARLHGKYFNTRRYKFKSIKVFKYITTLGGGSSNGVPPQEIGQKATWVDVGK